MRLRDLNVLIPQISAFDEELSLCIASAIEVCHSLRHVLDVNWLICHRETEDTNDYLDDISFLSFAKSGIGICSRFYKRQWGRWQIKESYHSTRLCHDGYHTTMLVLFLMFSDCPVSVSFKFKYEMKIWDPPLAWLMKSFPTQPTMT